MSKHTPGPWEVDLETGEINGGCAVLGAVYGGDDFPCSEEDMSEECKANARLIAAAPDLLKACKGVLIGLKAYETLGRKNIHLDALRAAIAKAEGEQ